MSWGLQLVSFGGLVGFGLGWIIGGAG